MANKKQNETDSQPRQKQKVVYVEAGIPTIYINHAQIGFSSLDANMLVGEIVGVDEEGAANIVPRARIMLSLQFIKELSRTLSRNVELFEKRNGVIQDVELQPISPNDAEVAH